MSKEIDLKQIKNILSERTTDKDINFIKEIRNFVQRMYIRLNKEDIKAINRKASKKYRDKFKKNRHYNDANKVNYAEKSHYNDANKIYNIKKVGNIFK